MKQAVGAEGQNYLSEPSEEGRRDGYEVYFAQSVGPILE